MGAVARERVAIDRELHAPKRHHYLLIIALVLVACYYALPQTYKDALTGWISLPTPPNKPASEKPEADVKYKDVTGRVIFHGSAGQTAGRCSCSDHLDPSMYPKEQRVPGDGCAVSVDPCKLVKFDVEGVNPKCHTISSLCKGPSAVVPWIDGVDICPLMQRGGWGCGSVGGHDHHNFMAGVTIPEGMSLEANSLPNCTGSSLWSERAAGPSGATYPNRVDNPGLQFGVAPGYRLACKGGVVKGPPV